MIDPLFSTGNPDGDFARELASEAIVADVPAMLDTLPDGHEALVIGDVGRSDDFISRQGDNEYGFGGTCGLVSCANILREFGIPADEREVVRHAVENGQCHVDSSDAEKSGGTTAESQAQLLSDYGIHAHVERNGSLESLAEKVEGGHGVIAGVNAGLLWDDARAYENGYANHAISIHSVARDPQNGEVLGFYGTDSGRGEPSDAARFIPAQLMEECHIAPGGMCVVTNDTWPSATSAPSV